MRTIRDNYYIITGHTYEEYCKKYRHGIGKGKLLSFTEEEAKYLKKNKFYWEVIGPDGKTLYCQVHKVKPKHVIIPLVIAGVIGGGTAAGVIYLPKLFKKFDGQVTEAEWKSSFENICNINESRKLNYKTNSTISMEFDRSPGNPSVYKNLMVDGDKEEATLISQTDGEQQIYMARLKQVPVIYANDKFEFGVTTIVNNIAQMLVGLNEQMSEFTFDKESKTYTYSYKAPGEPSSGEFMYLDTTLKFNSNKNVETLLSKYAIAGKNPSTPAIIFSSEIEYDYGSCSLTWGEDYKKAAQQYTAELKKDSSNEFMITDDLVNKKDLVEIVIYAENPINGLNRIIALDDTTKLESWFGNTKIYKNNFELERNVDFDYGTDTATGIYGIQFYEPIKSTDKLSLKIDFTPSSLKGASHPVIKFFSHS